ncbi:hypothetical protein DXT99_20175 [Pontibacter diazotrophicus]|uniref:Uncharacterized protein n=1 Tax=Pontibacter diazotrophicus TaxID=1400979 RepID=A0A3D8L7F9_9BACT|nr:hypothetical protein [Pontibacter diazotrophicus]RDV13338.1 hypothetical protein DXT99_20175 [Pontibacter diazotrophicus]
MDVYQFNCYPRDTRADLVWEHGRFLAIRTEMGCSVVLYHMSGFFVEVWYSPEDNQIALVHGFERRELLEPYLEVIDLEKPIE